MGVRIKSGPTYLDVPAVWEVVVNLLVYSGKLAAAAYNKLPACIEIAGRTYYKAGWYRAAGMISDLLNELDPVAD